MRRAFYSGSLKIQAQAGEALDISHLARKTAW